MLDYLTLYVVILMNSLTVAIIWGAVVYSYRDFRPARFWLAASVLTMTGGIILALFAHTGSVAAILTANAAVIFGFYLFWSGIRVFYGASGRWRTGLLLTGVAIGAAMSAGDAIYLRGLAFFTGQALPMMLSAIFLFSAGRRSLGAAIAGTAMLIGIAGHVTMIVINIVRLAGYPDDGIFLIAPSYTLLAVIFSGTVWNYGFAVMAIDRLRAEVAHLAGVDELTGVANLRRLRERMREEDARARRTGRPYSVIMADMDRLKQINDRYGHSTGDAAIVAIAHALQDVLRPNDLVARIGGDEFCVLLPQTNLAAAKRIAGRISAAVREKAANEEFLRKAVSPTVSLGVAQWTGDKASTAKDVMRRADEALYDVKTVRSEANDVDPSSAIRLDDSRIAS